MGNVASVVVQRVDIQTPKKNAQIVMNIGEVGAVDLRAIPIQIEGEIDHINTTGPIRVYKGTYYEFVVIVCLYLYTNLRVVGLFRIKNAA